MTEVWLVSVDDQLIGQLEPPIVQHNGAMVLTLLGECPRIDKQNVKLGLSVYDLADNELIGAAEAPLSRFWTVGFGMGDGILYPFNIIYAGIPPVPEFTVTSGTDMVRTALLFGGEL